MRIVVLNPRNEGTDAATAASPNLDPDADPGAYLPGSEFADFHIRKATAVQQVQDIARQGFDVVINLCDGSWADDTPGVEVVQALEAQPRRLAVLSPAP